VKEDRTINITRVQRKLSNILRYFSSYRRIILFTIKRLDFGGVYEKRDDVGLLTNRLSMTNFRDRVRDDVQSYPCTVKKEYGEGFGGEPRNSFTTDHTNIMDLIIDGDDNNQMMFPWKELEKDLQILMNQKPHPIVTGSSTNFDHLGLTSVPSAPSSSELSKKYVLSHHSSPVDSTTPSFPWLETHTVVDPNSTKLSIEGFSIREGSSKAICEKYLEARGPGYYQMIDKNDGIAGLFSSPSVAPPHKYCRKSKACLMTRHKHWTEEEDEILRCAMAAMAREVDGTSNWSKISGKYFHSTRSETQCKNRWKNVSLL
jgi:hypothetical protein